MIKRKNESIMLFPNKKIRLNIYRGFLISSDDYREQIDIFLSPTVYRNKPELFPECFELSCADTKSCLEKLISDTNMWDMFDANPDNILTLGWWTQIKYYAIRLLTFKTSFFTSLTDRVSREKFATDQLFPTLIFLHRVFTSHKLWDNLLHNIKIMLIRFCNDGLSSALYAFFIFFPMLATDDCHPYIKN